MQVVLVYLEWFRRNSVLNCVLHPKIAKNLLQTPIFGVQGRSTISMLVPLESSSAVLVMISSKSVSICYRFHARWANSGKITISKGTPHSRGISSPSGTKLPHKKPESLGYHTVKTRSLYLTWAWLGIGSWQTDGRTDVRTDRRTNRIPIANTRSQQYTCFVQLSRVKSTENQHWCDYAVACHESNLWPLNCESDALAIVP